ncbi:protein of unknown function [Modestobacter italicus]|uniref:Saccharopine dehydrogenase NADP binding domain-containing protein n=1 Tax=Modestobacter italicus (strain DSM 44449 / CECT 9708 / BC 501) TaxID=2732864 RepID=I4F0I2_MODI5|nr:saccharopine dehydrogenase [Modestobacter marinus]CCH89145.1 protein of unknown function [Modestobacter marinus]
MVSDIWVLGATGRTGRAVVARLAAAGAPVVPVGRDHTRLTALGHARVVAGSLDEVLARLAQEAPAVVVNTVGPFDETAVRVARACPPGTHYVDVANELAAVQAVLDLDAEAAATGRVFVTAAGFGALATESALLHVCAGQPVPALVRVDAVPSVAMEAGTVGTALAGSILGGLPAGGFRVARGRLTRDRVGSAADRFSTPDGDEVTTGSLPSGELLTAWRGSGATSVVAASAMAPTGPVTRLIPALGLVLRVPGLTRLTVRGLARVPVRAAVRPRVHSWARARVSWRDGAERVGWLRAEDALDFTAAATAEVALRLARGEGRPGAHSPGELFGPDVAVAAGGEFVALSA